MESIHRSWNQGWGLGQVRWWAVVAGRGPCTLRAVRTTRLHERRCLHPSRGHLSATLEPHPEGRPHSLLPVQTPLRGSSKGPLRGVSEYMVGDARFEPAPIRVKEAWRTSIVIPASTSSCGFLLAPAKASAIAGIDSTSKTACVSHESRRLINGSTPW